MNLAKAIAMGRGRSDLVGKVSHGIAHVGGPLTGHTPSTAIVNLGASDPTPGGTNSAIDELHWALEGRPVATGHYNISEIIPQTVVAHRMWREAFPQPRAERFLPVDGLQFMHSPSTREVWVNMMISRATLRARGRGLTETIRDGDLGQHFSAVAVVDQAVAGSYHVFEKRTTRVYTGRSADVVAEAVEEVRGDLWQTVTANPPYRRFYVYLGPAGERRMPQWLSVYATLFWLGSLTRYQPVELLDALDGVYGPFFREFLETQPKQLLYILASEAKKQNVTRAAIV